MVGVVGSAGQLYRSRYFHHVRVLSCSSETTLEQHQQREPLRISMKEPPGFSDAEEGYLHVTTSLTLTLVFYICLVYSNPQ